MRKEWALRRRCRISGKGCGGSPRDARRRRGVGLGRGRSGVRGRGARERRARGPLYQAAQMVLLSLDRERGGPRQRPASEVDAAAQMQVLGPADGRRSGEGARIHYLRHGSGQSRSTPIGTPTLPPPGN